MTDLARRRRFLLVLERADHNYTHAARMLGVTRQAVEQTAAKLGLAAVCRAERAKGAVAREAQREADARAPRRLDVCVECGRLFEARGNWGMLVCPVLECRDARRARRAAERYMALKERQGAGFGGDDAQGDR